MQRKRVGIVCICARHFLHVCVCTLFRHLLLFPRSTQKNEVIMSTICIQSNLEIFLGSHSVSPNPILYYFLSFFFHFASLSTSPSPSPSSYLFICMFGPCVYRRFSTHRIWPFVLLMPSHISVCNIIYVGLLASCLCSPSISVACLVRLFAQYIGYAVCIRLSLNESCSQITCEHTRAHTHSHTTTNCTNVN